MVQYVLRFKAFLLAHYPVALGINRTTPTVIGNQTTRIAELATSLKLLKDMADEAAALQHYKNKISLLFLVNRVRDGGKDKTGLSASALALCKSGAKTPREDGNRAVHQLNRYEVVAAIRAIAPDNYKRAGYCELYKFVYDQNFEDDDGFSDDEGSEADEDGDCVDY